MGSEAVAVNVTDSHLAGLVELAETLTTTGLRTMTTFVTLNVSPPAVELTVSR